MSIVRRNAPKPPTPKELGAERFFARLRSFDLECPACGAIYRIRHRPYHFRAKKTHQPPIWDARTGRFVCRSCNKHFVLGILAWDAPRGQGAGLLPLDQIPTWRQANALRAQLDSYWMPEGHEGIGRMENSNLAPTERPSDIDGGDDE